MDAFEFNKIAGAVLSALLVIVGSGVISNIIFTHPKPEKPGYVVEVADAGGKAESGTEEKDSDTKVPFVELLSTANAESGEKVAKKCAACHTFDNGGKNGQGPNLFNILGRDVASVADFSYSTALKEKGGQWTFDFLDCFLADPKTCVPGTKMVFKGVARDKQRADLIIYLRSLSDSPAALPSQSQ